MKCDSAPEKMASPVSSVTVTDDNPLHERYYPLGTRKRYLFEERMRRIRQAHRERLLEELHMSECTFRPKVLSGGSRDKASASSREGRSEEPNRHVDPNVSVFERLARQAEELQAKSLLRENQKELEEKNALACSFRPQINTFPLPETRHEPQPQVPVEDRLLCYGRAAALATERQRELQRQQESGKTCSNAKSASPLIDLESRRAARQEFEARNQQLLMRRELQSSMAERAAPSASFRPQISPASAALDEAAQACKRERDPKSTELESHSQKVGHSAEPTPSARAKELNSVKRGELLYERAMMSHVKKLQLAEKLQLHQEKEICQDHKPNINPFTEGWIQHSEHRKLFSKDFITRQELYREAKEELKDLVARKIEEERKNQAPSHVRISSDMILSQVERLYHDGLKASTLKTSSSPKASDLSSKECSFKPELSKGSLKVLRKMPQREKDFVARLARPGSATVRGDKSPSKRSTDDIFAEKGVHSPRLMNSVEGKVVGDSAGHATPLVTAFGTEAHHSQAPTPRRVIRPEDANAFFQRQLKAMQQREERIRIEKAKKTEEEMESCTFRPKTNPSATYKVHQQRELLQASSSSEAKQGRHDVRDEVSGVELFLTRQAEARRRREEKEKLLANMGLGKSAQRDKGRPITSERGVCAITEVTPFKLNTDRRAKWRQSLQSQSYTPKGDPHRCLSLSTEVAPSDSVVEPAPLFVPLPRQQRRVNFKLSPEEISVPDFTLYDSGEDSASDYFSPVEMS